MAYSHYKCSLEIKESLPINLYRPALNKNIILFFLTITITRNVFVIFQYCLIMLFDVMEVVTLSYIEVKKTDFINVKQFRDNDCCITFETLEKK